MRGLSSAADLGGAAGLAGRSFRLAPAFEGANIRMWIGFKHFLYLAEEAVLRYLSETGRAPRELFWLHKVCLHVAVAELRIRSPLMYGEPVLAQVRAAEEAGDGTLRLHVALSVERFGGTWQAASGWLTVAALSVNGTPAPVPGASGGGAGGER